MGGLATAWELSSGDWRKHLDSITVYQRGWRLGGKGASSRGRFGRIEEHGLHVLLGYYDATFRVLREVYGELDRAVTDPECPIRSWRDAVSPAGDVGLAERDGSTWSHFVTRFSGNDAIPGEPGAEDRPIQPLDMALARCGSCSTSIARWPHPRRRVRFLSVALRCRDPQPPTGRDLFGAQA